MKPTNRELSAASNVFRESALREIDATGQTTYADALPDAWWLISRHVAGKHSAYAVQTRLRKRWPNLRFRVVQGESSAEIHAIRVTERDRIEANERA